MIGCHGRYIRAISGLDVNLFETKYILDLVFYKEQAIFSTIHSMMILTKISAGLIMLVMSALPKRERR